MRVYYTVAVGSDKAKGNDVKKEPKKDTAKKK